MTRRTDLLAPATALVALAVYLPHGFEGYLSRDLGLYTYAGQQFAEGTAPYVGVLNRAGPLAHVLPGVGVLLGRAIGLPDVVGARVLFLGFALAAVVAAYLLARAVFASRLAGVTAAAALLSLEGFAEYATHGPREKTPMVLFGFLTLWAVRRRRWGTAGFFVGLATLTWQPAFVLGFVAALAGGLLLEPRRHRLGALGRIAVGGLLPLGITVGYYAVIGQLRTFWEAFLLINARYTEQSSITQTPARVWENLLVGFGWSIWVLLAGAALFLVLTVVLAVRLASRVAHGGEVAERDRALAALGAGHVAGLVWCLFVFNGWADALFLVPTMALGIAWPAVALAGRVRRPVATAVVALVVLVAVAASLVRSVATAEDDLVRQRASVAAVFDRLPADATLLSVEAPQPLVISGRTNPSRHQMFAGGLTDYVDDTWPGGIEGYADWIAEQAPTVISVTGEHPWLEPVLAQHYRAVGRAPGWAWYLHESVPEPVAEQVRAAVGRVRAGVPPSGS